MPIRKLLREGIPPDEAQFLTGVFEDCLTELGLVDREDRLVTIVAYRVNGYGTGTRARRNCVEKCSAEYIQIEPIVARSTSVRVDTLPRRSSSAESKSLAQSHLKRGGSTSSSSISISLRLRASATTIDFHGGCRRSEQLEPTSREPHRRLRVSQLQGRVDSGSSARIRPRSEAR